MKIQLQNVWHSNLQVKNRSVHWSWQARWFINFNKLVHILHHFEYEQQQQQEVTIESTDE